MQYHHYRGKGLHNESGKPKQKERKPKTAMVKAYTIESSWYRVITNRAVGGGPPYGGGGEGSNKQYVTMLNTTGRSGGRRLWLIVKKQSSAL